MALPFVKADAWMTGSIKAICGWLLPSDNRRLGGAALTRERGADQNGLMPPLSG